jgi:hypothetical protein
VHACLQVGPLLIAPNPLLTLLAPLLFETLLLAPFPALLLALLPALVLAPLPASAVWTLALLPSR